MNSTLYDNRAEEMNYPIQTASPGCNYFSNKRPSKILMLGATGMFLVAPVCAIPNNQIDRELKKIVTQNIQNKKDVFFSMDEELKEPILEYQGFLNNLYKTEITPKEKIIKDILSYKSLIVSWDGFNALPLEVDSASNALKLIDFIGGDIFNLVEDYYPNPHGTISFMWENDKDECVSLEVGNEVFSYYVKLASQKVLFIENKDINKYESDKLANYIKVL